MNVNRFTARNSREALALVSDLAPAVDETLARLAGYAR